MKKYDVVIIGAGTAGLTARKEVAKVTDNYIVVDDGPMGTTCARVGCMPSKVLIQAANDFHRRHSLEEQGIEGSENLIINQDKAMAHVRKLRDRFVKGVKSSLPAWSDKLVPKRATFIDAHTLDLGDEQVSAGKIIIATGSRPVIPGPWNEFKDHLVTTDEFFELETLPETVAVIGLGVIGLEIGQALNRLGVKVIAAGLGKELGGLTEPELQDYTLKKLSEEMPIYTKGANLVGIDSNNKLLVEVDGKQLAVDKAIMAVGRRPNIDKLNIENLNVELNRGIPAFSQTTFSLNEQKHIFLVGDVTGERALLHEAADEGLIAGHNAVNIESCFKRRPVLGITFSDPNIATIGSRWAQLKEEGTDFVTGFVSFEGQGRSIVKLKEKGMLKIFADHKDGKILGAELFAPDGEHLAHLIAWGIALKLSVQEMLTMPFYHPVIEEGLRTALRDARDQLEADEKLELFRCQDTPIR
jgi:dihydrolipoamide dehydrogenase